MGSGPFLEFEKPIAELEKKISDMKDFSIGGDVELGSEIASMQKKLDKLRTEIYDNLTRWQKVQLSRHPKRPYTLDYIGAISTDFVELHGDRYDYSLVNYEKSQIEVEIICKEHGIFNQKPNKHLMGQNCPNVH